MTSPVSSSSSSSGSSSSTANPPPLSTAAASAASAASALPALLVPSPTNQPQPRSSPPVAEDQIENTLKCPICIDWFTDPILLDCSHSLCLDCARRLALHDGGTNTAEVTCPLCMVVTAVTGGDKAREMEDGLIADALKRFDVVPPRKSRARIEDLRTCYEAFIKNGLVAIGPNDAKPTALHMWRAVVARMESQTQDALGDKRSESPSAASNAADATTSTATGEEGEEGREGIDDPMKQLRFKKNILLANLVTHFREQQEQRVSSPAPGFATSTSGFQQHQDHHHQQQQQQDEQAYDEMFMDQGGEGSEDGEVTEDGEVRSTASSKVIGGEGGGAGGERGTSRWGGLSGKSEAAAIGSRHMWVGNLPNGVKEEHLREIFKGYGGVESVRMLRRTPQSMTGFLHFKETSEAIRAKKEMDGKPFVGGKLPQPLMKIQYQSRGVNKALRSIRVHNLPPKTTSADLVELFSEFGRVEVAVINVASNIGLLALETVEQADRAMVRWHDNVWRDRHLFIDYALRENISKEDPYLRGDRDRLGRDRERGGGGGGGDRERERERDRHRDSDREREWERERERERSRDRGKEREREGSRERMRGGRGGPPPPSRYDDRDRDRMRGPPSPPFPPGPPQHPPNRLLVLPSARGCPPFEVYAEDLEKLRELVELMQSHLAPHQRQTLEDALQNRALYEGITQLIGRNRRDMSAVLRDLRLELGLPPIDHRRGPPPPPPHHHRHPPPPYHDGPIPSHPRDRGPPMPPPPSLRDGPYGSPGSDRARDRDRMRHPSPPPPDYRHFPPPGHPDHHPHHHQHPSPYPYDRSPPRGGGYRDDPRDYSPGRRGGGRLPPPPPPGYYDDRRGPPPPPHPSSLGPPPPGYGGNRDRESSRDREREHARERERYGGGRGGMPSPARGRRRSRSRSPPREMMPPQLPPYPGDQGRKRSRDRAGNSLGRSRSRSLSPSSRRHRAEGGAGWDPRAAPQFPPRPPSQGRDSHPFPPNHPSPALPQGPPPSQRGGGGAAAAGAGGGAPPPLKAECDQFLQSLTNGLGSGSGSVIGGSALPPSSPLPASQSLTPGASASASSRIWLNSGNAATYACYDAALNLIKELLTPHYRAQVIDKDGFKRLAEEVTLLLVQQLLEHRLEGRADVPAHYKGVTENLVREALPKGAGKK